MMVKPMELTMFNLDDVDNIEGDAENEEEYFVSLQRAINSLDAWKMQGRFGRAMMEAIAGGECMLGRNPTRDYWGNRIPSRNEVQASTKGSAAYVRTCMGDEWANMMEAV